MTTITRRVTKKGVAIQGQFYSSALLLGEIGQLVSVDLPEGPLPLTLVASCGTQSLEIQDNRALLEGIDAAVLARRIQGRINLRTCTGAPCHRALYH